MYTPTPCREVANGFLRLHVLGNVNVLGAAVALSNPDNRMPFAEQMYWYPGGENGTSTTCVPEGDKWADHR